MTIKKFINIALWGLTLGTTAAWVFADTPGLVPIAFLVFAVLTSEDAKK